MTSQGHYTHHLVIKVGTESNHIFTTL